MIPRKLPIDPHTEFYNYHGKEHTVHWLPHERINPQEYEDYRELFHLNAVHTIKSRTIALGKVAKEMGIWCKHIGLAYFKIHSEPERQELIELLAYTIHRDPKSFLSAFKGEGIKKSQENIAILADIIALAPVDFMTGLHGEHGAFTKAFGRDQYYFYELIRKRLAETRSSVDPLLLYKLTGVNINKDGKPANPKPRVRK